MRDKADHIIGLIGKSGSGKTTILQHFRDKGFNVIESYTDRPKRFEGETGHVFISRDEIEHYKDEMIAYTFFDNHHYFAVRSQYRGKGITFYTIDPVGVIELERLVTDAKLTFIYIEVDECVRKERILNRHLKGNINIDDACLKKAEEEVERRIKHDREVFSTIKCNYVIDNNGSAEETIKEIEKLLESII
ncbi:MAG TPA: guanylate kinase [Clostridium sp.]|jgi:guanylate kinase|nr:guanylate kinase [Clostridia bacterium]HCW03688.1 guanylate kinase [Clostridium sp.]